MAKSKNASTHHNGRKNHRNGIKKIKIERYRSLKACNLRYLINRRRTQKFDPSIKKSVNYTKLIEKQRKNKH